MKYGKNKYWENEEGELVEFGNSFMRCFDKAGKLQFGFKNAKGEYLVKFVLDRAELCESKEGAPFLQQTIEDWREIHEQNND